MYTGGERKARRCCNRRFASNDRDRCNNHFSFRVHEDIYIFIVFSYVTIFLESRFDEFEFSCSRIKKIQFQDVSSETRAFFPINISTLKIKIKNEVQSTLQNVLKRDGKRLDDNFEGLQNNKLKLHTR